MDTVFCFNICAVAALITIQVALVVRKMTKGRTNVLFSAFVLSVLISAVMDIWDSAYGVVLPITTYNLYLRHLINYIYFIFHSMSAPLFILLVYSYTGIWYHIKKHISILNMIIIPYSIVFILFIINLFTGIIFYFDNEMHYQRGSLIYLVYALSVYYIFFGLVVVIKFKRLLPLGKWIIILSFIPTNVFAIVIQMIFPSVRIEHFCLTMMLLTIAIEVLRPEEMMDYVVGTASHSAFISDVERANKAGDPKAILFVKIVNNSVLRSNIGHDYYSNLLKMLADKMYQISKIMAPHSQIYYIDQGAFAAIDAQDEYDQLLDMGRVIAAFAQETVRIEQLEIMLDARICLVKTPGDIDDTDSLLNFASTFQNKLPDDKRVMALSTVADSKDFRMRNNMDAIINRGIINYNFQMFYQPIYSIEKQKFVSAEALIRLEDEQFGFVSPALFIPAAEESGAIHKIGDFVLEDVCRFIGSCDFESLGLEYIEVNLSVAQCIESNLYEKIDALMEQYGVRPEQINLEITETGVDYDPVVTDRNIDLLNKRGLTFSLDDYGTGYSSIKRVVTLPLNIVKLDKSLVDDMDSPLMWIVIKNTVNMLKRMNKKILVEGVEDKRAFERFAELGCDYIQGYYFSKPLNESNFLKFVISKNFGVEI